MLLASLAIATLPLLHASAARSIDAVSVALPTKASVASVRGRLRDGTWTDWESLSVDDEQDPESLESNLVLFPEEVTDVQVDGAVAAVHPIDIDDAPPSYSLAGLVALGTPKILSREDWGADDDLLFTDRAPSSGPSEPAGDNGDVPAVSDAASQREQDCLDAQRNFPGDFKTTGKKTTTVNGSTLLWPHTYSKKIDLLVVHHTAVAVKGDTRSGVERVRAIYQYHAKNKGWGDVGYHYLIDEDGQIYEGKSGGDYVVGGHAYCHNVNTIGIALLGNFEVEKPSQDQMKALQWLLDNLADKYDVNLDENATYHGQTYSSPILGHGDLLSTSCPGWYVRQTLPQVREHVEEGDLAATISFPKKPTSSSSRSSSGRSSVRSGSRSSRSSAAPSSRPIVREGISALGSDTLGGRPGGEVPFSVRFTTGKTGAVAGQRIADVKRSDQAIGVWQFIGGEYVPVRGDIVAETSVPRNATTAIQLKVTIPRERGTFTLTIGDAVFKIVPSGRVAEPGSSSSVRSRQSTSSSRSSVSRRPYSSTPSTVSSRPSSSLVSSASAAGDRGPSIAIRPPIRFPISEPTVEKWLSDTSEPWS